MNQHKIQPGQPRNWTAEPDGVKGTFNYIVSRVIEQLTNADLQNLGITAKAVDAGRVSVSGMPNLYTDSNGPMKTDSIQIQAILLPSCLLTVASRCIHG